MDKKYAGTTIVLPTATVEMLDEIRTCLEVKTGIVKLSRRQVIESLISQKMDTLYHVAEIAPAESIPPTQETRVADFSREALEMTSEMFHRSRELGRRRGRK